MAPELFDGRRVDVRCDVFALAVTLFEALYGRRPFPGTSLPEIVAAAAADRVVVPEARRGSRELERVVLRGLAADPERRWTSIEELAAALARAVAPSRRRRGGLVASACSE